jgi:hypothetical protein
VVVAVLLIAGDHDPEMEFVEVVGSVKFEEIEVNAVVTWVNPNDPDWVKDRADALSKYKDAAADATHNRRFESNGEIDVCLRSILKFAPWIRKIFLVVASAKQIESAHESLRGLLDRNVGSIQIVHHAEFMDKSALPTFNSLAIESQVHKIPQLSEFFVKFDDDFILGRPLKKSDFLAVTDNGEMKMKVSLSSSHRDDLQNFSPNDRLLWRRMVATNYARLNTLCKLKKFVWKSSKHCRAITHGPQILRKSLCQEVATLFAAESSKTQHNRFRSEGDLMTVCLMAHQFALLTKRVVATWDTRKTFVMVPVAQWNHDLASDFESIARDPPLAFCVNNASTASNDSAMTTLRLFLARFKRYDLFFIIYITGMCWTQMGVRVKMHKFLAAESTSKRLCQHCRLRKFQSSR